jgi:Protein of unknown function (DUF3460)
MSLQSIVRSIFLRPDYKSDATQFITQLKAARPGLDAAQQDGRALLWDKSIDRSAQAEQRAGHVPQQAYVYQTKG